MKYLLKEKWFAFGNDFSIADEQGRERFFVDGRAFSLGDKLSFRDMNGNELAFIKQRLLSWGPTYEITRAGQLMAVVKKEHFTFFKCRFTVDVPGPDDLEAEGNFWEHEYGFRRGAASVASVSKRWFALTDTYAVDVGTGEDEVLILACTVIIDLVCHEKDNT